MRIEAGSSRGSTPLLLGVAVEKCLIEIAAEKLEGLLLEVLWFVYGAVTQFGHEFSGLGRGEAGAIELVDGAG